MGGHSTIDYYVWLSSDWAYLGGVRFTQIAARHGLKIHHIPVRMQDVYGAAAGCCLRSAPWQRQSYRIRELTRWSTRLGIKGQHRAELLSGGYRSRVLHGDRRAKARF